MFKPLLLILKVREFEKVLKSFENEKISKVYISGYTEWELYKEKIFASVVNQAEEKGYTHISVISDDGLLYPTVLNNTLLLNLAKELVEAKPVVTTAWCLLDYNTDLVNITDKPLFKNIPAKISDYQLLEIHNLPEQRNFQTYFTGMALTTMKTEMWIKYPFMCFRGKGWGYASDYHLSKRLQNDNVKIFTSRKLQIEHVREHQSKINRKELLLGDKYKDIKWDEL